MKTKILNHIKAIAFDADDTMWINEPYFQQIESKFCKLLEDFATHHAISQELLKTEIQNLSIYGYGVKGYMLSMIEAAMNISNKKISMDVIERAIEYGKDMLSKPVELIDDIEQVLVQLKTKYKIVVATKGDLLDQEQKLKRSGLENHFHHIEVMSDKKEEDYKKLIKHLDILPSEFLMIGNSLKSDVLPVLALGGHAIHIPFHTTWEHEKIHHQVEHDNLMSLNKISDIMDFL